MVYRHENISNYGIFAVLLRLCNIRSLIVYLAWKETPALAKSEYKQQMLAPLKSRVCEVNFDLSDDARVK